jgi:hypothetical protein
MKKKLKFVKYKDMKRKAEEIEFDSLIQKMELINCFNPEDEFKILKKSHNIMNKIDKLELREIKDILKETYMRYKRYTANIDMEGLDEIKNNINEYIKEYNSKKIQLQYFKKTKNLIKIMIKTDKLILNEINYNSNKYNKIS